MCKEQKQKRVLKIIDIVNYTLTKCVSIVFQLACMYNYELTYMCVCHNILNWQKYYACVTRGITNIINIHGFNFQYALVLCVDV